MLSQKKEAPLTPPYLLLITVVTVQLMQVGGALQREGGGLSRVTPGLSREAGPKEGRRGGPRPPKWEISFMAPPCQEQRPALELPPRRSARPKASPASLNLLHRAGKIKCLARKEDLKGVNYYHLLPFLARTGTTPGAGNTDKTKTRLKEQSQEARITPFSGEETG